ncbi:Pyrimidodiazepine synthase [Trichoplax sp. H2]|uniref:Glutathione transferase n=1 Tax=Trichoplax adhaerens TaxID=10228 RepID=B3RQ56_TRIAD|nr:hypothetical protein TRIADDRAFT_21044 [Trichoplax adhaerens]EDV28295.1 hypothetical protein TRIADDRAFT_21044 [Trichoplax adhaerens]RDD40778.1 Pyrimidodiazepine synthase [Trichoplax sp. H2]|eukprot:XP_002110129.1 hypothetical protein TRIADDRAFT_21044 [Trichoplax adhaerens]
MAKVIQLQKGDSKPSSTKDLKLYGMRFDPYSMALRLIMRRKGLDFDFYSIKMSDRPDFLQQLNPNGQIPVLEHGDTVVYETIIIYEYLEDTFTDKPLRSSDPATRAMDRIFLHEIYTNLPPVIRAMMEGIEAKRLLDQLLRVENRLQKQGSPYFGGNEPNYIDFMVWSWLELIPALKRAFTLTFELPRGSFSNTWAWIGRMDKEPVINAERKASRVNAEIRSRFFKSVADGSPDYMVGL